MGSCSKFWYENARAFSARPLAPSLALRGRARGERHDNTLHACSPSLQPLTLALTCDPCPERSGLAPYGFTPRKIQHMEYLSLLVALLAFIGAIVHRLSHRQFDHVQERTSRKQALEECADRRLEYKASTIPGAGSGIFTQDLIRKNQYCCYFDGHDLTSGEYAKRLAALGSAAASSYAIDDGKEGVRDGYREPRAPCGVAQLVNDGQRLWFQHPTSLPQAMAARDEYAVSRRMHARLHM